jgi:hypothetical protein
LLHGFEDVAGIKALQMIEVVERTCGGAYRLIVQRNICFLTHDDLLMPYTGNGSCQAH